MKCVIEAELTPERFVELGEPYRIFRNSGKRLVALASQMPHLGYPGHWLFPEKPPSQHRLGIYDEADGRLLGVIATHFPINDVAFSQDDDDVIIGTGSYDGGWRFEGYLLRYHWRTGDIEQLIGQNREIVACRYDGTGAIAVLMRPVDEEEFGVDEPDAWNIVIGLKIGSGPSPWKGMPAEVPRGDPRLDGLLPSAPDDFGFPENSPILDDDRRSAWKQEAVEWLQGVRARYYQGIWDLQWIDSSAFAFTASRLALEVRDLQGEIRQSFECEGNGVELIRHPQMGLLTHVQQAGAPAGGIFDVRSVLWQWKEEKNFKKHCFDRPYAFSFDSSGYGLAIDLSWGQRRDRKNLILGFDGKSIANVDCGVTNRLGPVAFPHGLEMLHFLKREYEDCNDGYRLWHHQARGRFVVGRQWDSSDRDFCPVTSIAYSKGEILGAGSVYNRAAHQNLGNFLELIELQSGRRSASIQLPCSPTRVTVFEDRQTGIVGFSNSVVALFDLKSQRLVDEIDLSRNGMASVPLSFAIRGDNVLIGTHDGRILLARLVS